MKIKSGDNIIVTAGKDRGKNGKIIRVFPDTNMVLIEGINIKKKHQRARKSNEKGQIIDKAYPVHVSNVMILDPKTNKATRIGYTIEGNKKVRVSKQSGAVLV